MGFVNSGILGPKVTLPASDQLDIPVSNYGE